MSHSTGLDQLDFQLMRELESDARQTYTELASKLGVTRPIITNRVRQLLDSGVIDIICLADPTALGFEIIATLAINVQSGHIKDVVQRLVDCSSIRQIHLCTGSFHIVAWAFLRNNEDLENLLINELDSIPGVQRVETMLLAQVVKWRPVLLADGSEPGMRENRAKDPIKLDDIDVKLIKELQIDARQKATNLAQKLGVHVATINRRIQRLLHEDVIQFRTFIQPLSLGYHGNALIGLSCDPAKSVMWPMQLHPTNRSKPLLFALVYTI